LGVFWKFAFAKAQKLHKKNTYFGGAKMKKIMYFIPFCGTKLS
jgi:hypothetical protein